MKNLDIIEEAHALSGLMEAMGSLTKVAEATGISKATISKKIAAKRLVSRIAEDIKENATTKDYAALATIAGQPKDKQWDLYLGFLANGRSWLEYELRKSEPKKYTVRGVATYEPSRSFTINRAVLRKMNKEKMEKLVKYIRTLVEAD